MKVTVQIKTSSESQEEKSLGAKEGLVIMLLKSRKYLGSPFVQREETIKDMQADWKCENKPVDLPDLLLMELQMDTQKPSVVRAAAKKADGPE
ncbi:hypothetical protein llap_3029 [Limosa lapponica baueri]|uniref:Uncharacterized protein n=1 Tax=Limosa lapponica baueri TaxID=1758121 RepID=A0A2I0UKQ6_LIMLA|nr:hypothetical protein llap_3029 [Limosa lapponica baueri]